MSDKNRGLYEKFKVYRDDGQSEEGAKHNKCKYFVLVQSEMIHRELIPHGTKTYPIPKD